MPVFWLAQILIVVFAVKLGWLPAQGMRSIRTHDPMLDLLRHLVLPGFCITIYYLAVVARVARASMLGILHQDFVLTARAKGIGRQAVLWRHVLRNAAIPVITVVGYNFGTSLTVPFSPRPCLPGRAWAACSSTRSPTAIIPCCRVSSCWPR